MIAHGYMKCLPSCIAICIACSLALLNLMWMILQLWCVNIFIYCSLFSLLISFVFISASLAAIAKNRPVHYSSILSALLNLDLSGSSMGGHPASIRYSLRTAFLGFLRCTNPSIIEVTILASACEVIWHFYVVVLFKRTFFLLLMRALRLGNCIKWQCTWLNCACIWISLFLNF